jgi:hypothetical protein
MHDARTVGGFRNEGRRSPAPGLLVWIGLCCLLSSCGSANPHKPALVQTSDRPASLRQVQRAFRVEGMLLVPTLISHGDVLMNYSILIDPSARPIPATVSVFRTIGMAHANADVTCERNACLVARNVVLSVRRKSNSTDRQQVLRALRHIGRPVTPP